jgi:hypothetical protein
LARATSSERTIQATARVLRNVIEIRGTGASWIGRPVVTSTGSLSRKIAALFSMTYQTFPWDGPDQVLSTVSYHPKRDEILVQMGEEKWRIRSSIFGPLTFEYGRVPFAVHEKLTGRFGIFRGESVVSTGELGFRTCTIRDPPPELEWFFANFALGYLIRNLLWEALR